MRDDKYPTLTSLGLGPQLDALERLAIKGRQTHPSDDWRARGIAEHLSHAEAHAMNAHGNERPFDTVTGEHESLHSALRSLMAAACFNEEQR
jgi:hypothetical protein